MTITDEQLSAWRAAHAATTPGEWVQDPNDKAYVRCGWQTIGSANLNHHDAGLLAIAHEAMPALIAEVERLRNEISRMKPVVDAALWRDHGDNGELDDAVDAYRSSL